MDGTILFDHSCSFLPLPIAETRTVCVYVCVLSMRACVLAGTWAVSSVSVTASVQPESSLASLASLASLPGYHRTVCALCVQCALGFVELR